MFTIHGLWIGAQQALTQVLDRVPATAAARRRRALQRVVRAPNQVSSRVQIKVAETHEEFVAALRLLHDSYVNLGYADAAPDGVRVTPYHLLPTTTVLIAKIDDTVIGTLSVIKDSPLGLPSEAIIDIRRLRRRGCQVAEASSIAIDPSFRDGGVLFLLLKYLWHNLTKCDIRYLLVSVNPRHETFYEDILLFRRRATKKIFGYSFVNGAPAVPMSLDLLHAAERYRKVYGAAKGRHNLHRFFVEDTAPNLSFPDSTLTMGCRSLSRYTLSWLHRTNALQAHLGNAVFRTAMRMIYGDGPTRATGLNSTLDRLELDEATLANSQWMRFTTAVKPDAMSLSTKRNAASGIDV